MLKTKENWGDIFGCFFGCKLKWGELKKRTMFRSRAGVKIPNSEFYEWYQEAVCPRCGKIYHREVKDVS
jgi:hypothetical protein